MPVPVPVPVLSYNVLTHVASMLPQRALRTALGFDTLDICRRLHIAPCRLGNGNRGNSGNSSNSNARLSLVCMLKHKFSRITVHYIDSGVTVRVEAAYSGNGNVTMRVFRPTRRLGFTHWVKQVQVEDAKAEDSDSSSSDRGRDRDRPTNVNLHIWSELFVTHSVHEPQPKDAWPLAHAQ